MKKSNPKTYPNLVKAKRLQSTEYYEGTFAEIKDKLHGHIYIEYFQVTLPDNNVIYGDEFIESYSELCAKFGTEPLKE